jgi:hypothetical protein
MGKRSHAHPHSLRVPSVRSAARQIFISSRFEIRKTIMYQHRPTHIRHRILVVLPRGDFVRVLVGNQQSAAVEGSRQARDHSVHLGVGARGEGARRAAEDVARGGFGEGDDAGAGAVVVGEKAVLDAAGDVAEGGLRVDYEIFVGVASPDFEGRGRGVSWFFWSGLHSLHGRVTADYLPWLM